MMELPRHQLHVEERPDGLGTRGADSFEGFLLVPWIMGLFYFVEGAAEGRAVK